MHNRPAIGMRRALLAAFVGLALFATSCGGSTDNAVAASPEPAADTATSSPDAPTEASLVGSTVTGGQIDFASLEGQDVVLWFWAPW